LCPYWIFETTVKSRTGNILDSAWWGAGLVAALFILALANVIPSVDPPWLAIAVSAATYLICIPAVAYQMRGSFLYESGLSLQPVNQCHACGYNLTGNTSGRCPECGSEILNSEQRRVEALAQLRKCRGDRIGLIICTVCCCGGLLLFRYGQDKAMLLGALAAWCSAGIGVMCVAQMIHFRWVPDNRALMDRRGISNGRGGRRKTGQPDDHE